MKKHEHRFFRIFFLLLAAGHGLAGASPLCASLGAQSIAQNAHGRNSPQSMHYHGRRENPGATVFTVREVESRVIEGEDAALVVLVTFSAPVNPRSVRRERVCLNGRTGESNPKIEYNRAGTVMRIVFRGTKMARLKGKLVSILLEGVQSFNGTPLENPEIAFTVGSRMVCLTDTNHHEEPDSGSHHAEDHTPMKPIGGTAGSGTSNTGSSGTGGSGSGSQNSSGGMTHIQGSGNAPSSSASGSTDGGTMRHIQGGARGSGSAR